jgi:hypothetical protein
VGYAAGDVGDAVPGALAGLARLRDGSQERRGAGDPGRPAP